MKTSQEASGMLEEKVYEALLGVCWLVIAGLFVLVPFAYVMSLVLQVL